MKFVQILTVAVGVQAIALPEIFLRRGTGITGTLLPSSLSHQLSIFNKVCVIEVNGDGSSNLGGELGITNNADGSQSIGGESGINVAAAKGNKTSGATGKNYNFTF